MLSRWSQKWQCIQCKYIYGRHSKSIKIDSHRCGVCKGKLEFLGRLKPDGTFAKPKQKAPSAFTIFMKKHMADIKKKYPAAKHGEIMRILSQKYKLSKQNGNIMWCAINMILLIVADNNDVYCCH